MRSRSGSLKGASTIALLVAAHIYERGIRYLQLSNLKTQGSEEFLVLLGVKVIDTLNAIASLAGPLRRFLILYFSYKRS